MEPKEDACGNRSRFQNISQVKENQGIMRRRTPVSLASNSAPTCHVFSVIDAEIAGKREGIAHWPVGGKTTLFSYEKKTPVLSKTYCFDRRWISAGNLWNYGISLIVES
jgi:hypothetical protein